MKNHKPGPFLERAYLEAIVMGLCIGLSALLINRWVGDSSWPVRILTLLLVGGVLCLIQFGIVRARRK